MYTYLVEWHTHTFFGGRYEGRETVCMNEQDPDKAANRAQREVHRRAFQDLSIGAIKIDSVKEQ